MKKILIVLLFTLPAVIFADDGIRRRDGLLMIGLGGADITYSESDQAYFDAMESDPDIERVPAYVDLTLGYSFIPHTYLTVGMHGVADRFTNTLYTDDWIQVNSYLLSVGFINYPFKTGLYWGANYGSAGLQSTDSDNTEYTLYEGTGYGVKVGLDFDRNADGASLTLAGAMNVLDLEGYGDDDYIIAYSVYVTLNFM